MIVCHMSPYEFTKAALRQAFFAFRIHLSPSEFTEVVSKSPLSFSLFLDFSKKGKRNVFRLPPILAVSGRKIHPGVGLVTAAGIDAISSNPRLGSVGEDV